MANFEHKRYPALELQGDGDRVPYAKFTPEKRTFGEHTVHVGVLETDDADVIARLRDAIAAGRDPDLSEVDAPAPAEKTAKDVDLASLDKDALLAFADEHQIPVDKRLGEDNLRAAIQAAIQEAQ